MDHIFISAEQEMLKFLIAIADKEGYRLNGNPDVRGKVILGLVNNERKYGAPYCPCRVRTGDCAEDAAIICPCQYHELDLALHGHCKCKLFYVKEEL